MSSRRSRNAGLAHRFVIHAGKNGNGNQPSAIGSHGNPGADGLHRRFEHRGPAERMHIDQLYAGHRSRAQHRARDGIGNIVEFQIEDDAVAERGNLFHGFGAGAGEELAADFEHADQVRNFLRKLQRRRQRVEVESYD